MKKLVLDANILLSATLGTRVRSLVQDYSDSVALYTPEACLEEAQYYVIRVSENRHRDSSRGLRILSELA